MTDSDKKPFAKKRFGQHFLTDKNLLKKIVRAASVKPGDRVLEIGPGRGALTEAILEAGAKVTAIEVDRDLAAYLKERFSADERIEILTIDALKASFTELSKERDCRFKIVSNLPYNISGPILAKFLDERAAFTLMVLMFQKEVAVRIASKPGTKEYGILSVISQAYADVKIEFHVSRHLFSPKPNVDSSVVSFKLLEAPRFPIEDEEFFKEVVRSAFGQRRKTLHNALKALGIGIEDITKALTDTNIAPQRRGETLSVEEFGRLSNELIKYKAASKN